METKTVQLVKVYTLHMHDIRDYSYEQRCVAAAYDPASLLEYIDKYKTDEYNEYPLNETELRILPYKKYFKKGSPLEWFKNSYTISSNWIDMKDLDRVKAKCIFLS